MLQDIRCGRYLRLHIFFAATLCTCSRMTILGTRSAGINSLSFCLFHTLFICRGGVLQPSSATFWKLDVTVVLVLIYFPPVSIYLCCSSIKRKLHVLCGVVFGITNIAVNDICGTVRCATYSHLSAFNFVLLGRLNLYLAYCFLLTSHPKLLSKFLRITYFGISKLKY